MPRINNEKFYSSAVKAHGVCAKGLNWLSQESQLVRFDAILELLPQDLKSFSVADAGCGFGDFYLYLNEKNKTPKEYVGVDSIQETAAIASKKTQCDIIVADVTRDKLPTKDYYVCSGALNILTAFETYLFIQNCYKSSKRGFIFNALHGDKKSEIYNYLTTAKIRSISKELHVKKVIIKDGYLQGDVTVAFLK